MAASICDIPASAYELGSLKKDFRISRIQLALCVGMLVFLLAFIRWMGFAAFPQALAPQVAEDYVLLCGIIAALVGVGGWGGWEIRKLFKSRGTRVLLFDDGFVSIRQDQVFVCRWDEVAAVRDGFISANDAYIRCCTVRKQSGEQWTIRNDVELIHGFSQLVQALIDETKRRLAPPMLAALQAGETLDFGGLELTPEGIALDDRRLAWSELKSIRCDDLRVEIEQRGAWVTWAAIASGSIDNRFVLVEVANQFKQQAMAMTLLA